MGLGQGLGSVVSPSPNPKASSACAAACCAAASAEAASAAWSPPSKSTAVSPLATDLRLVLAFLAALSPLESCRFVFSPCLGLGRGL